MREEEREKKGTNNRERGRERRVGERRSEAERKGRDDEEGSKG